MLACVHVCMLQYDAYCTRLIMNRLITAQLTSKFSEPRDVYTDRNVIWFIKGQEVFKLLAFFTVLVLLYTISVCIVFLYWHHLFYSIIRAYIPINWGILHISPISANFINSPIFVPLFRMLSFSYSVYDAFTHHALHVLDATAITFDLNWLQLSLTNNKIYVSWQSNVEAVVNWHKNKILVN